MRIYLARPFRSRSFFNDTATTEIYTLSLHDALPIYTCFLSICCAATMKTRATPCGIDRKSTRLNSSHLVISYAVFCLKKIIYHATLTMQEDSPLFLPEQESHNDKV